MTVFRTLMCCTFVLMASVSTTRAEENIPTFETRYMECWINVPFSSGNPDFNDNGGSISGSLYIDGHERNFTASWTVTDIGLFKQRPVGSRTFLDGSIHCKRKATVTSTRNCVPKKKGLGGTSTCDVCIGTDCKRIRAKLTIAMPHEQKVHKNLTRNE